MLELLRDKLSKCTVYVIIGLLILSFAIWGLSGSSGPNRSHSSTFSYKNTLISVGLFQQRFSQSFSGLSGKDQALIRQSPQLQKTMQIQILDAMVAQHRLGKLYKSNNYLVGTPLLQSVMATDPRFLTDGLFSVQRFQSYLKQLRIPQASFMDDQRRIIIDRMLHHFLATSSPVLPQQDQQLQLVLGQKRFYDQYFIEVPKPKPASRKALKSYYDKHKASFQLPPSSDIRYVVLSMADMIRSAKPTKSALRAFYHAHPQWYQVPASIKLRKILLVKKNDTALRDPKLVKYLASGTAIDKQRQIQLLKKYQIERVIAPKSHVVRGLPPKLRVITDQAPIGQWVVYRSPAGESHLVQVLERHSDSLMPYEKVLKRLKSDYIHHITQKQYFDRLDQMKDRAFNHPDALTQLAIFLNTKVHKATLVQGSSPHVPWLSDTRIQSFVFNPESKPSFNSPVFELSGHRAVVIQIVTHHPKRLQSLAQVEAEIEARLLHASWREAAKTKAEKTKEALIGGKPLVLDKDLRLVKDLTMMIDDKSTKKNPKALIFGLDFSIDHGVGMMPLNDHHYLVVQLKSIEPNPMASSFHFKSDGLAWLDTHAMKFALLHHHES